MDPGKLVRHWKDRFAAPRRPWRWEWLFALGIAATVAVLIAMAVTTRNAAEQRRSAETWQMHTVDVLRTVGALQSAIDRADAADHSYLLTRDVAHARALADRQREIAAAERRLMTLTRDNRLQRVHLRRFREALGLYLASLKPELRADGGSAGPDVYPLLIQSDDHLDSVRRALAAVRETERGLLVERTASFGAAADRLQRHAFVLLGIGFLLIAGAAGALLSAMRASRAKNVVVAELRRASTTDELTQLPNRRHFLARLAEELARAQRHGEPLAVALLDIDHFKRINDTYGHAAGDLVLKETASVLRAATRTEESIGRIGGEEFAVVMPATEVHAARRACERLRAAQNGRTFALPSGDEVRVTLSGGVAIAHPGEPIQQLMARADHALYEAKRQGRDRIRMAA
ncbi:MAG TPA: diguanylate cyclase [Allosphingosinicella sp.]|nr:diguanylate cyclase [Allosphingosinicella sp.]